MRRGLLPAALLLLLAASTAMASIPGVVWFGDDFETYGDDYWGISLKRCSPNWYGEGTAGNLKLYRPGNYLAPPPGPGGVGVCSFCMRGRTGTGLPAWAWTGDAFRMAAKSAGCKQVFHFQSCPGLSTVTPWYHGQAFMLDSNGMDIAGWEISSIGRRAKLLRGGSFLYTYTFIDTSWHDFDITYDPETGLTRWLVDGVEITNATQTAGRAVDRVYFYDNHLGNENDDDAWFDEVRVGTNQPVVTAPVGHISITDVTPDVTWTHAFPSPDPIAYQVKVCSTDSPTGAAAYDSGVLPGSAVSLTTAALPTKVWLYAFVKEQQADGWTSWSAIGNGGFYIDVSAPAKPIMDGPSGVVVGAKPNVAFHSADSFTSAQAKITTDSAGLNVVWQDPDWVSTTAGGLACEAMLEENTTYYAWAQVANAAGTNGWCHVPKQFAITRSGEGRDTRHFSEEWAVAGTTRTCLYHSSGAPNDGFGSWMVGYENEAQARNFSTSMDSNAQNWMLLMEDNVGDVRSRGIREHRVANIDLNKGITYLVAVRMEDGGSDGADAIWQACNFVINDAGTGAPGDEALASFRLRQASAAICSDGQTYIGSQSFAGTYDWQIVRMTGRNKVVGNPSTCVWKMYLNENPEPIVTSTGCTNRALADGDFRDDDCIGLGQGSHARIGAYYFDWTDVNTAGDYAPGEWNGIAQGTFASIGEARNGGTTTAGLPRPAGTEVKIAEITGPAVITYEVGEPPDPLAKYIVRWRSIGYDDWDGDGDKEYGVTVPEVSEATQVYYAQDITPSGNGAALRINDPENLYAAPGRIVTHMKGWLQQTLKSQQTWNEGHDGWPMHYHQMGFFDVYGPVLRGVPAGGIEISDGPADYSPVFMAQSAVAGGGCTEQFPNGINNTGTYAKIFGKVTYVGPLNIDLVTGLPDPAPNGSYTICIDDGTGLLNYEHEWADIAQQLRPEKGIYVTLDLNKQPGSPIPQVGQYYSATGVIGYHSYWFDWKWPANRTIKSLHYTTLQRIIP